MYDFIPFILGGMMFVLGLIMAINPKASTKKEFQNDENMIAKTKKNGFVVIACGIIFILIGIIRFF
jgi:uncharacterized membrane protein HdeD (DUF308 family)